MFNSRIPMTVGLALTAVIAAIYAPHLTGLTATAGPLPEVEPPPVQPLVDVMPIPEPVIEVVDVPLPVVIEPAIADADPLPEPEPEPIVVKPRRVEIVIALDTSGSMNGLIDSTRARIWDIVNQTVSAKPTPDVRVGLLTYGTPGGSSVDQGWVKHQMDLTDDLDTFYGRLMGLNTAGGDEYVGWVLHEALNEMSWSPGDDTVRMVFVAGNETADLGREFHDFRVVAGAASERGVTVHTVFAGNENQGRMLLWEQVADMGGGTYTAIDQNAAVVAVATPFDQKLRELNGALNTTYVPYGAGGSAGVANQVEQDNNAMKYGSMGARTSSKGSAAYRNDSWDLVDGLESGVQIGDLEEEELPAAMVPMNAAERQAYVDDAKKQRDTVNAEIAAITGEREKWLSDKRAEADAPDDLDSALREAVVESMEEAGFAF